MPQFTTWAMHEDQTAVDQSHPLSSVLASFLGSEAQGQVKTQLETMDPSGVGCLTAVS